MIMEIMVAAVLFGQKGLVKRNAVVPSAEATMNRKTLFWLKKPVKLLTYCGACSPLSSFERGRADAAAATMRLRTDRNDSSLLRFTVVGGAMAATGGFVATFVNGNILTF
jgi:hypothetical protein